MADGLSGDLNMDVPGTAPAGGGSRVLDYAGMSMKVTVRDGVAKATLTGHATYGRGAGRPVSVSRDLMLPESLAGSLRAFMEEHAPGLEDEAVDAAMQAHMVARRKGEL